MQVSFNFPLFPLSLRKLPSWIKTASKAQKKSLPDVIITKLEERSIPTPSERR